jgi:hypothetical protein
LWLFVQFYLFNELCLVHFWAYVLSLTRFCVILFLKSFVRCIFELVFCALRIFVLNHNVQRFHVLHVLKIILFNCSTCSIVLT